MNISRTCAGEMEYVKALGYDFTAMYVGGGTTTILEDELVKTLELAKKLFPPSKKFHAKRIRKSS